MGDNRYIYGLHDPGGEDHLRIEQEGTLFSKEIEALVPPAMLNLGDQPRGWIVFTEEIGHDPNDMGWADYTPYSDVGFGTIVRLNNGYKPNGTIPRPEFYEDFAKRCGNFAMSLGNERWIIGNEPNHEQERPDGIQISPADYATCFALCYEEIKIRSPDNQVILAAIAPWNADTKYPANPDGDWVVYMLDVLYVLDGMGVMPDGLALHTYTHGHDPALITSEAKMEPPFEYCRYEFRTYRDFLEALSERYFDLPVYITETNQGDSPWLNSDQGWIVRAYQEINQWNITGSKLFIHCLCLYRWGNYDKWVIEGKDLLLCDLRNALEFGFTRPENGGSNMETVYQTSFEGGPGAFYYYQGDGELQCPLGFTPKWVQGSSPSVNFRPAYSMVTAVQPEKHSGDQATRFRTAYASHDGCLMSDPIPVLPNCPIWFSAWAMGKGSGGQHAMRIGIGGPSEADHLSPDIVWSPWYAQPPEGWGDGAWEHLSLEIIPEYSHVTLFLHSKADYAGDESAAHFDDLLLEQDTLPQPPGPPQPPPPGAGLQARLLALCDLVLADLVDATASVEALKAEIADMDQYAVPAIPLEVL